MGKIGFGALHIIPIHSQHWGRLFLPFLDEDPKTAETLSKIVLNCCQLARSLLCW